MDVRGEGHPDRGLGMAGLRLLTLSPSAQRAEVLGVISFAWLWLLVLVDIGFLWLGFLSPIDQAEWMIRDLWQRNGTRARSNDRLRLVAIDQPSYDDKIDPEWDLAEAGPEEAMALNIFDNRVVVGSGHSTGF